MNTTAIYHRPESEFAYLFEKDKMHIRLRTTRQDVRHVQLLCGDPYTLYKEAWYQRRIEMDKILSTDLHDYWQVTVSAEFRRLSYGFSIESFDGLHVFMGIMGLSF